MGDADESLYKRPRDESGALEKGGGGSLRLRDSGIRVVAGPRMSAYWQRRRPYFGGCGSGRGSAGGVTLRPPSSPGAWCLDCPWTGESRCERRLRKSLGQGSASRGRKSRVGAVGSADR